MNEEVTFILDGEVVQGRKGQTILEAADNVGTYIPRLCAHKDLRPHGSCRVCVVSVNGRLQSACTQPIAEGIVVEVVSENLGKVRADIVEMLLVEGNHFCMFCEKSGSCELQALAYRFGVTAPKFPYLFPLRELDATHPEVVLDHNRCILCGRCVQASRDIDHKNVFQFVGRGRETRIAVNSNAGLGQTNADVRDRAISVCPVGAILRRGNAYRVPIGERTYDRETIGGPVDAPSAAKVETE